MEKKPSAVLLTVAPFMARLLIRSIASTMRMTYVNFGAYRDMLAGGRRIILAFWHGRLMMMPYSYPGNGITILVSRSKDGELVARTVEGFGIESVRGSSSKGWLGGVRGLLKAVRDGRDVAITPDGPRGPGMKAQMGAIQIARTTGLPIIPMTFSASKKKTFKSWDSFILPYPFSRGVFICADPIRVERDAGAEEMEDARKRLEETLCRITAEADGYF